MLSPVKRFMDRKAIVAGVLPVFMLHACDRVVDTPAPQAASTAIKTAPSSSAAVEPTTPQSSGPPPGYTDGEGVNEGYPDLTPPVLTGDAAKGKTGAQSLLQSFARALELKEFDQAWEMLSPNDRAKWPKAEFTRMFADLGRITVAVPGGDVEGGAGSLYYASPFTLSATDRDGRPVRYEGEAMLRRVNDVDGATPEQLRWHFDRLAVDWTH